MLAGNPAADPAAAVVNAWTMIDYPDALPYRLEVKMFRAAMIL
jgi:hypothetical protein